MSNVLSNVGGFFKKIAPLVSTALSMGGPVGALAGTALTAVTGAMSGGKAPSSLEDLTAAFAGSPDQQKFLADLKTSEQAFQVQLKQLDIQSVEDLEKLSVDDRASARTMQVAVRSRVPSILAFTVTAGFFGILLYVFGHGVRTEARDMANIMVGTLGTAWGGVMTYYFGSSAGSDRKTEILANSQAKS